VNKVNFSWRASEKCKDAVLSNQSMPGRTMDPMDSNHYGGELVAESILPDLVPFVAAAPDLFNALIDILPHAEIIINQNHPALRNAYAALNKAINK
jgi:hypothetical protein